MAGTGIYGELLRAQLHLSSSDLSPTGTGLIYFNTTSSIAKVYNGSAWKTFLWADFTNVTGTLGIANGGTGQTAALAAFDALAAGLTGTPAKGDVYTYGTSTSVRTAVGANGTVLTANSGASGGVSWNPVSVTNTINAVSADYTILDGDGYRAIFVTTGSTDRTVTLPAAASNSGREIIVKKVDSGTGNVTVAGNIDGDAGGFILDLQYEHVNVISDGTAWFIA